MRYPETERTNQERGTEAVEWQESRGKNEKIAKSEITFSLGNFTSKDACKMCLTAKCHGRQQCGLPAMQGGGTSPWDNNPLQAFVFSLIVPTSGLLDLLQD